MCLTGGAKTEMNISPGLPSLWFYTRASYPLQHPPKTSQEIILGSPRWPFRTGMLVHGSVAQLSGVWHKLLAALCVFSDCKSASLRCIMTGMASGSIVVFYNDFNRWHHEYQTRYWPSQRPGQALTGAAVARRELHAALPPSGSSRHTVP